ncbi:TauD/TfdA family dioxygenase [Amycolatopsis sp. NBC_01480]|uniref:TauD/TfdA family dioxygenase n=1 Tax=Amycolatopsis sp. NBC_01480 TaxID=2903562 RepID=UPI002E2828A3|nr:TauD/TfdA family dioxygenase [Amycolatopsis sp. NBC_01480]
MLDSAGTADVLAACRLDVAASDDVGELAACLAAHGVARFDGVPDERTLLELAGRLGAVVAHRDSGQDGMTVISNRAAGAAGPVRAGFTDRPLLPHTDGSDRHRPPHLMMLVCERPGRGGQCVVVDGQAVHADLAATAPDALADLSAPRSAYFGGAAGLVGQVFEPYPDGHISLRLRLDKLARFSPRAQRALPVLRAAIDRHLVTFPLDAGAGYVVNNRRWLHGRRSFTGDRVMCRVHVEPRPGWRIPAGFPARTAA